MYLYVYCMYNVCIVCICLYICMYLFVLYVLRVPAVVTAPGRRPRGPVPAPRAPGGPQPRHHPSPSCEGYRFGPIRRQSLKTR